MKYVNPDQIANEIVDFQPLTHRGRLLRWAFIVRTYDGPLALFHELEFMRPYQLCNIRVRQLPTSAFTLAIHDPQLQAAGLDPHCFLLELMEFFNLTQNELHAFSCDCGGDISARQMADSITEIAKWK